MDNTLPKLPAELTLVQQARMVEHLRVALQAQTPPHPVERIETHISWVLVTPTLAYKLKKALNPGFLDYRTRAQRLQGCREELRLNRRLAPELYLRVVDIGGTPDTPVLDGAGPPIDHAVCMRAFDQTGLWDRLAASGHLGAVQVERLADQIARFQAGAAVAGPDSRFGRAEQVREPVIDNFDALAALLADPVDHAALDVLRTWEADAFASLANSFEQRRLAGRVREGHGDLHLGNVAEIDGRTTVFDGIEFNESFRWLDTAGEIAFLAMDLHAHDLPALAHRFVDRWLQESGDHGGLAVLRYHMVYRALVRAKIAALRAQQAGRSPADAARPGLALASRLSRPAAPLLLVTHGASGSGKSTLARCLVEAIGAVHLRADVERKRLFGLPAEARSGSAPGAGLYTAEATKATYERLFERAATVLQAGCSTVLDATFLLRSQRDGARRVAAAAGAPLIILDIDLDMTTLQARVQARSQAGGDASEADLAVLALQLRSAEPLAPDERAGVLDCTPLARGGHDGMRNDWQRRLQPWRPTPDH
jgi:aminoglycoside phosphotransferase family enzyme/predicted kinase